MLRAAYGVLFRSSHKHNITILAENESTHLYLVENPNGELKIGMPADVFRR